MRRERNQPLNLRVAAAPPSGAPMEADASKASELEPHPVAAPSPFSEKSLLPPLPPSPDGFTAYVSDGAAGKRAVRDKPAKLSREKFPRSEAAAIEPAVKPRNPAARRATSPARFGYWIAGGCALLWTGAFVAFVAGFGKLGPFDYAPFRDVVIATLAILPALFMLLFAYALRQGSRLGEDVRTTRRLSEDLIGPVAISAAQTGELMRTMRTEIERAAQAAEVAERRLSILRDTLSDESRRLIEAAHGAQASARTLGKTLGHERGELEALSSSLEARTAEVTAAVSRQTHLAAEVSDLAQVQLAEAQASLAARAADLSAVAAEVREGAEAAAEMLTQQERQFDLTGAALTQRLTALGMELNRERDALAELTNGLKTDHEDLSARAESQHARLLVVAEQTRSDGEAASQTALHTAESLQQLIAEAVAQIRAASDIASESRRAAEADARFTIETLSGAAEQAQNAAAARLATLEEQAQNFGSSALQRIEQLGEAAFAAGQRADVAFDARVGAAKRAIDQSAAAVEEAGLRSAQRIEVGLASTRAALTELDALLEEVDGRFAKLPEEARVRAEAVRSAVHQGVGDLTAAARRAAEETTAIDEAFQERMRRNYDTLSEAVRLMGRVAGAVDAAARPPEAETQPSASPVADIRAVDLMMRAREAAAQRQEAELTVGDPLPVAVGDSHARFADPRTETPILETTRSFPPESSMQTGAPASSWRDSSAADLFAPEAASAGTSAESSGLRPRLKLTAAPEAESVPIIVEAAAQTPPTRDRSNGWSWKDLLSSMPAEASPSEDDDDVIADRLMAEIQALGLDVAALLPRSQVDDIAQGLQSGHGMGIREGVRRLAPAAVRRLSRRVLTDAVLRREADGFVRRYAALVDDAVRRDTDGFLASALLGSDAGRAFLMLDAAIGDLAH